MNTAMTTTKTPASEADIAHLIAHLKAWPRDEADEQTYQELVATTDFARQDFTHARLQWAQLSQLDLKGADFRHADLRRAHFYQCNLSSANFEGADLEGATFKECTLKAANLRGARLYYVSFQGCDLTNAEMGRTYAAKTTFDACTLVGTIMNDADLHDTSWTDNEISDINLWGANLFNSNFPSNADRDVDAGTVGLWPICPPTGAFIAYKQLSYGEIATLLVPETAQRSNAHSHKCRCSEAVVLSIVDADGNPVPTGHSLYRSDFVYTVGQTVVPDDWDENSDDECSHGIHFFMSPGLAKIYNG